MHPPLSERARDALRALTIELDTNTPDAVALELLERGLIVRAESGDDGRPRYLFTVRGARWKLDLLIQAEDAVPCRCGEPRGQHDVLSPHACQALECGCRSFTAARPLYLTAARDPGEPAKGAA